MDTDRLLIQELVPNMSLDFNQFARVLVIYTGGTIGMQNIDGGKSV